MKIIPSPLIHKIVSTNKLSWQVVLNSEKSIYTFLNPVSYLLALKNKSLYSQFDGIFCDGYFLASAIRGLYGKKIDRKSFDMTSLASGLFLYAQQNYKTIYLIGSKEDEITNSIKIIGKHYPNLKIIGYRNGYFSSEEEMHNISIQISKKNPDFLIVGLGSITQEEFLLKVKKDGYQGIGFTCGGFIHQTSKKQIDYYPPIFDRLNIRFLYRMYNEKHTRKRYIHAAIKFPISIIRERFF